MDLEALEGASQLAEDIRYASKVNQRFVPKDSEVMRDLVIANVDTVVDNCHRLMDACVRAVRQLGSTRNACSIMNWVPDEILEQIIWETMDPALGSKSIVQLCTVSKQWHEVSLGTRRLWSCIVVDPTTPLVGIQTLLSRAGSYPLSVVVRTSETYMDDSRKSDLHAKLKLVFEHLPSIRDLDIVVCKEAAKFMQKISSAPATQLRSLAVTVDGHVTGDPLQLFNLKTGNAALTSLRFTGPLPMHKPLTRFAVPTVTVLALIGDDIANLYLKPAHLASALCAMPLLAQLDLWHVRTTLRDTAKATRGPTDIVLRHLKRAMLGRSGDFVPWFFEHVRFPSSARISLDIGEDRWKLASYGQTVTRFLETRRMKEDRTNGRLIRQPYAAMFLIKQGIYYASFHLVLSVGKTGGGEIEIITPAYLDEIDTLWSALPLAEVTVFSLRPGNAPLSVWTTYPYHLARLASRLVAVETLWISWPPEWLYHMDLLLRATPNIIAAQGGVNFFPYLSSVIFHAIQLGPVTLPLTAGNSSDGPTEPAQSRSVRRVDILKPTMYSWWVARGRDLSFALVDCAMTEEDRMCLALFFDSLRH
ncbi:hypothetical protein EIP91_009140 [Steccherinum ochraceum]|uniref:Uncharacterized protein n=1 Tax=Steccherinum ochraceum TaxID=92696 RepID=A0A4R0R4C1_9APHY|nr:hypothetical protein EIP91_009140 [Steccherinum ochraceum]